MKTNYSLKQAAALLCTLFTLTVSGDKLLSSPIPITNPSFEALTGSDPAYFDSSGRLTNGCFSRAPKFGKGFTGGLILFTNSNPIPGWQIDADTPAGTFNPPTNLFQFWPTNGQNTAYVGVVTNSQSEGMIVQKLCEILTPGNYTLEVEVGRRSDNDSTPDYRIQLLAGGVVIAQASNTFTIPKGDFVTARATAIVQHDNPNLGSALEIRLIRSSAKAQVNFDNVRLDGPSHIAMSILRTEQEVQIGWTSHLTGKYQVQWTSTLAPAFWINLGNAVQADGALTSVSDSLRTQEQRFYRVLSLDCGN